MIQSWKRDNNGLEARPARAYHSSSHTFSPFCYVYFDFHSLLVFTVIYVSKVRITYDIDLSSDNTDSLFISIIVLRA